MSFRTDKLLPATVAMIAAKVDNLCESLPAMLKGQCHALVSSNRDAVIHFISSGRSAEAICKAIRMCQPALNGGRAETQDTTHDNVNQNTQQQQQLQHMEAAVVKTANFVPEGLTCDCT
jgi:hypothetical protein